MEKWVSGLIGALACCCLILPLQAEAGSGEAYQYLNKTMDQYHKTLDVFTDLAAGGNHFAARCETVRRAADPIDLAGVSVDDGWTLNCRSGSTCVKNTFSAVDPAYWGGWYFQNGILSGCDAAPACNWGEYPDAGLNLTGAKKLTFWARGDKGGEKIEFFMGGIGWDVEKKKPIPGAYHDSTARIPTSGHVTTLSKNWKQYTISLGRNDLSYIAGGFGWVANAAKNPKGAVFYLDDIQYVMDRTASPRLSASYTTLPVAPGDNFDTILKNTAYVYDNAITLIAYLARGAKDDRKRAKLLADAYVYAQKNDRFYKDGRLRNAYQAGDLPLPPGWTPNGRKDAARLPGWWDVTGKKWIEDSGHVGTDTGNMSWVMIALLRAYKVFGEEKYLTAAKTLGEWIETNTKDTRGNGGYTGGVKGWEPACGGSDPLSVTWKSTEHNIDAYVAFMTLYDLTKGDEAAMWRARALHAKQFVRSMWGACGPTHFATGTGDDGITPNCLFYPEDANTWGLMALGEVADYGPGIDWVSTECGVSESCFPNKTAVGIDFDADGDGIWWEGTAHTVIAKRIKKDNEGADLLLNNLRNAQRLAPNADKKGIVAVCHDGVSTGMAEFLLYNRLHIAATSWYALSELRHNPYWGIHTTIAIPHQEE